VRPSCLPFYRAPCLPFRRIWSASFMACLQGLRPWVGLFRLEPGSVKSGVKNIVERVLHRIATAGLEKMARPSFQIPSVGRLRAAPFAGLGSKHSPVDALEQGGKGLCVGQDGCGFEQFLEPLQIGDRQNSFLEANWNRAHPRAKHTQKRALD
jgi:hypothetical protein